MSTGSNSITIIISITSIITITIIIIIVKIIGTTSVIKIGLSSLLSWTRLYLDYDNPSYHMFNIMIGNIYIIHSSY